MNKQSFLLGYKEAGNFKRTETKSSLGAEPVIPLRFGDQSGEMTYSKRDLDLMELLRQKLRIENLLKSRKREAQAKVKRLSPGVTVLE